MSLKPQPIGPVPEPTAYVAHAAFPDANIYMRLRRRRGSLSTVPHGRVPDLTYR